MRNWGLDMAPELEILGLELHLRFRHQSGRRQRSRRICTADLHSFSARVFLEGSRKHIKSLNTHVLSDLVPKIKIKNLYMGPPGIG